MDIHTERAANAIYAEKYRSIVEDLRDSPGAAAAAWAVLRRRALAEAEAWVAPGDRLADPEGFEVIERPDSPPEP